MKFKPQLTKQAYDSSGRKMTVTDKNAGSNKYQEELLIMVEDKDNKINFMLEVDDFKDKLDMMRNAYAQFQNMQMKKSHDESILKTVDSEVFYTKASETM